MTLSVITGGKLKGMNKTGGGGGDSHSHRREHWMAKYLWNALVAGKRASSTEQLRQRISKELGQNIDLWQVNHILKVVRKNADAYGWSVLHATKGPDDSNRRYVPVLYDRNDGFDPVIYYEADDMPYIKYGMQSSVLTITSMAENESIALDMVIAVLASRSDKRHLRDVQTTLSASARMLRDVAERLFK